MAETKTIFVQNSSREPPVWGGGRLMNTIGDISDSPDDVIDSDVEYGCLEAPSDFGF